MSGRDVLIRDEKLNESIIEGTGRVQWGLGEQIFPQELFWDVSGWQNENELHPYQVGWGGGDQVTQKKGECPCCYIEDKLIGSVIFCVGMTEHQTTVTKLPSSTHTCSYLHTHHSAGNYVEHSQPLRPHVNNPETWTTWSAGALQTNTHHSWVNWCCGLYFSASLLCKWNKQ